MNEPVSEVAQARRIAIVRCCGLGDVAQMTPLLRQIRGDAPEAKIEVFLNHNVASLLDGSPWVDAVHALPSADFLPSRNNLLLWRLWLKVRQAGPFDALFYLELSWSRSLLARVVSATHRIAFRTEGRKPYLPWDHTVTVPIDYPRNADHTSLWFLRLWLDSTGHADRGFSADLGQLKDVQHPPLVRHVALVPRAGNAITAGDVKQWPLHCWSTVAKLLLGQGWVPVVVGQAGDLDMTTMPPGTLDMQGQHSIRDAAQYVSRCAGVIGNDSGLYHIAMAMGIPAVGLFGPTAAARTGPFRAPHGLALTTALPCMPCYANACRVPAEGRPEEERPFCLSALAPHDVCDRALAHFSQFDRCRTGSPHS